MGTTVAGALDPIREIAKAAASADAWLHVDAAWGSFGLLGPDAARFRKGLDGAHSLTFDEHKHAGAPVTSSFLLVRDRTSLEELRPPTGGGSLPQEGSRRTSRPDPGLTSPLLRQAVPHAWPVARVEDARRRRKKGVGTRQDDAPSWRRHRRSSRWELALEPDTWLVVFRPRMPRRRVARDAVSRELRRRINASGRWMVNLPRCRGIRVPRDLHQPAHDGGAWDELLAHLERCASSDVRNALMGRRA
jgi:L-2,4-diaminobutyrate decarboxylase